MVGFFPKVPSNPITYPVSRGGIVIATSVDARKTGAGLFLAGLHDLVGKVADRLVDRLAKLQRHPVVGASENR